MTEPDDMVVMATTLAESVAHCSKNAVRVDGIFVLCFRASDDTAGSALVAPDMPIDAMIGMVVSALAKLRSEKR